MRIGIDIDGVLTNLEQWQLDYGSKFYYERYKSRINNYKGYETTEIFMDDTKKDDEFWNEYFKEYSINTPVRNFASEVIKKLKDEGNEIFIITARGSFLSHSSHIMSFEENKKTVIKWLEKNAIYYDEIVFSQEDKLQICLANKIDIMIEDKPKNVNSISTRLPVICYHASYNENCSGENIKRCYSWYDIYAQIQEIDK